jgi:hypothetical protein
MEMVPRLGAKYGLQIQTLSKTRDAYRTAEYIASGLPAAPALMLNDERIVQGGPISEEALEAAIRRHLKL